MLKWHVGMTLAVVVAGAITSVFITVIMIMLVSKQRLKQIDKYCSALLVRRRRLSRSCLLSHLPPNP